MQSRTQTILLVGELLSIGAALLLLPCIFIDLAFGTGLVDALIDAMLVGFGGAAILTGVAIHEGWFAEDLSHPGAVDEADRSPEGGRREPTL
jgi:hypothetical protein